VQERFDEAVSTGEKAVALNPNGDLNMHLLAVTYNCIRRYEEAITLAKEAIRRNPYCLAIYITNLGWSYSMLGRWEEAIAEYKRALNRHPDHFPALTGLAIVYGMTGRLEEGRAVAAQILKMNPGYCIEKRKTPYKYKSDGESEREALRKVGIPEKAPQ
jgi:tetratricopeptide (TPR) repeat protein